MSYEDKDDMTLWNEYGAKGDVGGASTPVGLSSSVFKFTADKPYEKY